MLQENWKDGIRTSEGGRGGLKHISNGPWLSCELNMGTARGVVGVVPELLGLEWPMFCEALRTSKEHQAS